MTDTTENPTGPDDADDIAFAPTSDEIADGTQPSTLDDMPDEEGDAGVPDPEDVD